MSFESIMFAIALAVAHRAKKCMTMCFVNVAACYADIVFVIDNSGSIRDNNPPGVDNWRLILDFVKSIIEVFTVGQGATRVAVVDFGTVFF